MASGGGGAPSATFEWTSKPQQPRLTADAPPNLAFVFVVDEGLPSAAYSRIREALGRSASALPSAAAISLITFSATVSFYDLTRSGLAAASVLPARDSPTEGEIDDVLDGDWVGGPGGTNAPPSRVSVSRCFDNLLQVLEVFEESSAGTTAEEDHAFAHAKASVAARKPRAIGVAIELALSLVRRAKRAYGYKIDALKPTQRDAVSNDESMGVGGAQIIVFSGGDVSRGPGTAQTGDRIASSSDGPPAHEAYLDKLADICVSYESILSGFIVGIEDTDPAALLRIASPSGGCVINYEDWKARDTAARLASDLFSALSRPRGFGGKLIVTASTGVAVTRVIGRASAPPDVGGDDGNGSGMDVTQLRLRLGPVLRGDALTLYLRPDSLPRGTDYIVIQISVSYIDMNHRRVVRASTRRLRVARDLEGYLGSVDPAVVCVLVAKRSALLASRLAGEGGTAYESGMDKIRRDLDVQLRSFCRSVGKLTESKRGAGGTGGWRYVLPSHLRALPRLLFQLRRGPLIGLSFQYTDAATALRQLYARLGPDAALRAVAPVLKSFTADGQFENIPLSTLALQTRRILLLDQHLEVFVWSGAAVAGARYDGMRAACLDQAARAAATRLPAPIVRVVNEDASEERWLVCRMDPAHKDPRDVQVKAFPQLAREPPEDIDAVRERMPETDEPSFAQYLSKLLA